MRGTTNERERENVCVCVSVCVCANFRENVCGNYELKLYVCVFVPVCVFVCVSVLVNSDELPVSKMYRVRTLAVSVSKCFDICVYFILVK